MRILREIDIAIFLLQVVTFILGAVTVVIRIAQMRFKYPYLMIKKEDVAMMCFMSTPITIVLFRCIHTFK